MVQIKLGFPTGRYHATPWDHHVNEGVVEWPPSPWRILRALIATRYLKALDEVEEQTLTQLIHELASTHPSYSVPSTATAHTRHYMPIGQLDKKSGQERTTKVFDTFVHVPKDSSLTISWPNLSLSRECEEALALLLGRMSYLGRAESWIEASLVRQASTATESESAHQQQASTPVESDNVRPLNEDGVIAEDQELFRLLCPLPSEDLAAWRSRAFEEELERQLAISQEKARVSGKDPQKQKLSKKDKDKIDARFPRTVLEALEVETGTLQKQGWSGIPGARWVDYVRPRDLLNSSANRARQFYTKSDLPTVARFAVASQVPPRLTDALPFSEKIRQALMKYSDGHPVFSGKTEDGSPLQGNQHAFILPEANGEHGRITHVTLSAPMGFDGEAHNALDHLRKVWGHGKHTTQLILLGVGQPKDFAGSDLRAGLCPLLCESSVWESRTPFVPTRHAKNTRQGQPKLDETGLQIGSAEHDLKRLLADQGYPIPKRVDSIKTTDLNGKKTRWLQFRTLRRSGGGARGANQGFGFRIIFDRRVLGPIALGYGAHFGLGMFTPGSPDEK